MSRADPQALKTYLAEARTWDADRLAEAARSRRFAWIVAAGASAVAGAACLALAALSPLKSVEPYVVRVDRTTGAVDVMTALKASRPLTYDEAVTKHFLAQYVRARESWLAPAAETNFRQVAIMSTGLEQKRWVQAVRGSPAPGARPRYGRDDEAAVEVRAISFISPSIANVRFHRIVHIAEEARESDWIATVAFHYAGAPMSEADRWLNPLGFQVSSYRADPEVLP